MLLLISTLAHAGEFELVHQNVHVELGGRTQSLLIQNAPEYMISWVQNAYVESYQRLVACNSLRTQAPQMYRRALAIYQGSTRGLRFSSIQNLPSFPSEPIPRTSGRHILLRPEVWGATSPVLSKVCYARTSARELGKACSIPYGTQSPETSLIHTDALDQRRLCGPNTAEFNRLSFTFLEAALLRETHDTETVHRLINSCRANVIIDDDRAYRLPMRFWQGNCVNDE
jgi:hypothetical protein